MPINVVSPEGKAYSIPEEELSAYQAAGFSPEGDEARVGRLGEEYLDEKYGGTGGAIKAGALGALSGATLGLSDAALSGLGARDTLRELKERHPGASFAGNFVGSLAPALISGGAATPAGLASRAGASVTSGLTREGAGVLARTGAAAAGAAAEGALYGGGAYISESAIEDKPMTAAGFVGGMGEGALFAAPIGGAFHLGTEGLAKVRSLFPRSEVSDAAAAVAKSEAKGAIQSSIADADQMLQIAQEQIALDRAKAGSELTKEHITRTVFGAADPATLEAQAAHATNTTQLQQATDRLAMANRELKEFLAGGEEGHLNRLLSDVAAPDILASDKLAEHNSRLLYDDNALQNLAGLRSSIDQLPFTPVPLGEFGAPGARGFKTPEELAAAAAQAGVEPDLSALRPASPPPSEATGVSRPASRGGKVEDVWDASGGGLRKEDVEPPTPTPTPAPAPVPNKDIPLVTDDVPVPALKTEPHNLGGVDVNTDISSMDVPALNSLEERLAAAAESIAETATDADRRAVRSLWEKIEIRRDGLLNGTTPETPPPVTTPSGASTAGRLSDEDFQSMAKHAAGAMSAQEKDVALAYSKNGLYARINGALRRAANLPGGASLKAVDPEIRELAQTLDSALSRSPSPRPMVLGRGVHSGSAMRAANDMKVGDSFIDPGFVSTSYDDQIAKDYAQWIAGDKGGGVKFDISVPEGYPLLAIPSEFPKEREILLGRGGKFTVTDIIEAKGTEPKTIKLHLAMPEAHAAETPIPPGFNIEVGQGKQFAPNPRVVTSVPEFSEVGGSTGLSPRDHVFVLRPSQFLGKNLRIEPMDALPEWSDAATGAIEMRAIGGDDFSDSGRKTSAYKIVNGEDRFAAAIKDDRPVAIQFFPAFSKPREGLIEADELINKFARGEPPSSAATPAAPAVVTPAAPSAPETISGDIVVKKTGRRQMEAVMPDGTTRKLDMGERAQDDFLDEMMPPGFKPGGAAISTSREFSIRRGVPSTADDVADNAIYVVRPSELAERELYGNALETADGGKHGSDFPALWREGKKFDPIDAYVTKDGKVYIEDGNHRLQGAALSDREVAVHFRDGTGYEPQRNARPISGRIRDDLPPVAAVPVSPDGEAHQVGGQGAVFEADQGVPSPKNASVSGDSDLLSLLQGTSDRLSQGESIRSISRPAEDAYVAAKAKRTSEAAEHFRGLAAAAKDDESLAAKLASEPDRTVKVKGMRDQMRRAADDDAIERLLKKEHGKGTDIGPSVARAAKVIGDHESASADVAELLGASAPKTAAERAAQLKQARAAQAEVQGQRTAMTASKLDRTAIDPDVRQRIADSTVIDPHAQALMGNVHDEYQIGQEVARVQRAEAKEASRQTKREAREAARAARRAEREGRGAGGDALMDALRATGAHLGILDAIPVLGPVLKTVLKVRALYAALRRGGGNVAKSVEATVASKAARTRDRIVDATRLILDAKPPKGKMGPPVGAAVILGHRLFTGEPEANKKSKGGLGALYTARMDELSRALEPHAIDDAIADRYPTANAELQQAIVDQTKKGYQFLLDKAPKAPANARPVLGGGIPWSPSSAELHEWSRYVKAVSDPASVLEDLAKGVLSMEGAETLRVVYPPLFQLAQRTLIEAAPQMQNTVPYARRVAISIMYRIPVDTSMTPQHLRYLMPPPQGPTGGGAPPAAAPPPAGSGAPALTGPLQSGQNTMTALDRRAGS